MDIRDKVAVITGAAAGTGRVIALTLARLGARVVLADLDLASAHTVSAIITGRGGLSSVVPADIRDSSGVEAIAAAALDLGGGPHILVNNAGGWGSASRQFPAASPAEWEAVLDLNLRAPMRLTQRFLAPMTEAGAGVVVNISSSAGRGDQPYAAPEYGAAKAGLIRFSTALGGLRETTGVRVDCIVPGWIGLDRAHAERAAMPPAQRASLPELIPPQTVADTVTMLIRDDSLSGRIVLLPGGDTVQLLPRDGDNPQDLSTLWIMCSSYPQPSDRIRKDFLPNGSVAIEPETIMPPHQPLDRRTPSQPSPTPRQLSPTLRQPLPIPACRREDLWLPTPPLDQARPSHLVHPVWPSSARWPLRPCHLSAARRRPVLRPGWRRPARP